MSTGKLVSKDKKEEWLLEPWRLSGKGESPQGEHGATTGGSGRKDVETNCLPLCHLSLVSASSEPENRGAGA